MYITVCRVFLTYFQAVEGVLLFYIGGPPPGMLGREIQLHKCWGTKSTVCFLTCLIACGSAQINQCVRHGGVCSFFIWMFRKLCQNKCMHFIRIKSALDYPPPTLAFIKFLVIICLLENDSQYKVRCWCNEANRGLRAVLLLAHTAPTQFLCLQKKWIRILTSDPLFQYRSAHH